ncbi:acetate/propionate family kinase [Ancylobacter sp. WKF20]|uniref:acetate/propionate family kinase n=1 Tax=Ancylobacter sp. WKF20 TaxID=3039801 RepID=UPI00243422B6|nr:acetate/propionate family kinase [Ancylobacter sp. WKF20]WGD31620.1 acetate/propionate family kinase [Ancylobacter sp. WKF20]
MSDVLFVVNAGSSSIKFKLYGVTGDELEVMIAGALDGIGTRPRLRARDGAGQSLVEQDFTAQEIAGPHDAQHAIGDWITPLIDDHHLIGVGHRVVHGGPDYSHPVLIDSAVLARLESFIPLAPLHQLTNLDPIRVIRQRRPDLPQVACFDTAFHRGHPEIADRFALPRALYEDGVRRYGFHGLSYEYVSARLRAIDPHAAAGAVVIAHLGSGASACALRDGASQDSTMSFTALDGLPMGTRCGALDAGVVLHLIEQKGMSPSEVGHLLYHDSGLKGLSGISSDMRELISSDAPEAALAVDYFCLKVAQAVAQFIVTLGGLDALVFTAGIGERSAPVRARIAERLAFLGLELDADANARNALRIHAPGSSLRAFVIPTDEEGMIARHTLRLLGDVESEARQGAPRP